MVLEHDPRQHPLARGSIRFGPTRPSPTCRPTARSSTSAPAPSTSTSIRIFHTKALYDGFRKDEPDKRALILSRDAYIGAQANGAIFWSSDIYPTWDTLRRQIPTGLDFAASGLTYWSNDTGGWQ